MRYEGGRVDVVLTDIPSSSSKDDGVGGTYSAMGCMSHGSSTAVVAVGMRVADAYTTDPRLDGWLEVRFTTAKRGRAGDDVCGAIEVGTSDLTERHCWPGVLEEFSESSRFETRGPLCLVPRFLR